MLEMHRATLAELPRLLEIYEEAFPPEEQVLFPFLARRAKVGADAGKDARRRADFWVFAEDADEEECGEGSDAEDAKGAASAPLGFAYCFAPTAGTDPVYLYYFAFAASERGKGYGSEAIPLLAAHYAGHPLFLALEPEDACAENAAQRARRHAFYRRAGLADMPFGVIEVGVPYDVMALGGPVTFEDYRAAFARYLGWPRRLFYSIKRR